MGLATYTYNRSTSGGEIIRELVNASDGQGLHFDGTAGSIDIASPPDLGTSFSFEFILQAHQWPDSGRTDYIIDFGNGSDARNILGNFNSGDLSIILGDGSGVSFGVKVLDDLKVHHLVVTVDGTSAIAYDNGNQVGTATVPLADIDDCTAARLGSNYVGTGSWIDATFYRARLWNKTLTAAEVTASYENATVPFADRWGSQTVLIGVATGLDGWNALNTWNSQTTGGSNMILSANATGQYCRTNTTLEVGKKYRLTYTAASVTGTTYFGGNWLGGFTNIHEFDTAGTRTVDFTFEFSTGFINDYFYCVSGDVTSAVTLSNLSLVEIGCVVDLDLAFANQKQSLVVEDRSGSSDTGVNATGMMSASGVTQVTPIEQLNSKSARIGTGSVATPADGELLVSGNVGIGGLPTHLLDVGDYAGTTNGTENTMRCSGYQTGASNVFANLRLSNSSAAGGSYFGIAAQRDSNNYGVTANFTVNNTGAGATPLTAMSLRYDGLATFANGIAVTTGGVKFPATQSASADANTLDDYEEGSGSLAGGGAEITMSTSGTVTAAGDYWYTKVGNVCNFQFEFQTTGISSPVGTIRVALPFATAAAAYSAGAVRIYNETFTGSPFLNISPGVAYLSLEASVSGAGTGNITPTTGTRYYFGEVTYRTA